MAVMNFEYAATISSPTGSLADVAWLFNAPEVLRFVRGFANSSASWPSGPGREICTGVATRNALEPRVTGSRSRRSAAESIARAAATPVVLSPAADYDQVLAVGMGRSSSSTSSSLTRISLLPNRLAGKRPDAMRRRKVSTLTSKTVAAC